ncbi:MAG: GntR family transcriptional regulator [Deltaproteobacteria bacterium]|nr:GntR family transcriptional regulator [Deltaproteobacteria bacterium]
MEDAIIRRILDGTYPTGRPLPLERELAAALEVGRPTLREALQRLERDGWIASQKGVGNLVLDYRRTGTLNTLGPILRTGSKYAQELVVHMLEVRALLMPDAARGAVRTNPARVVAALAESAALPDEAETFARFDWYVNRQLTLLSPNPLFHLIVKSMDPPYEDLSVGYFGAPENRAASRRFYEGLQRAAMAHDAEAAAAVTAEAMQYSIGWFAALLAALEVS